MYNRFGLPALVLMAIMTVGLVSLADAANGNKAKGAKVEGKLVGVANNGVVIQKKGGTQVSLGVTAATKIELNEVKVPVTSLPIGAQVEANYDATTMIATKVEAKN